MRMVRGAPGSASPADEQPAGQRPRADHAEHLRLHDHAANLLGRAAVAGEVADRRAEDARRLERGAALRPREVVAGVDDVARAVARDVVLPHHHQPLGVGVGERRQQRRVDQLEGGGRGADAQGQHGDDRGGERRRAPQQPQRVAQLAAQAAERRAAAGLGRGWRRRGRCRATSASTSARRMASAAKRVRIRRRRAARDAPPRRLRGDRPVPRPRRRTASVPRSRRWRRTRDCQSVIMAPWLSSGEADAGDAAQRQHELLPLVALTAEHGGAGGRQPIVAPPPLPRPLHPPARRSSRGLRACRASRRATRSCS